MNHFHFIDQLVCTYIYSFIPSALWVTIIKHRSNESVIFHFLVQKKLIIIFFLIWFIQNFWSFYYAIVFLYQIIISEFPEWQCKPEASTCTNNLAYLLHHVCVSWNYRQHTWLALACQYSCWDESHCPSDLRSLSVRAYENKLPF